MRKRKHTIYNADDNRIRYCAILVELEDGSTRCCMKECIKFEKITSGGQRKIMDLCPVHDKDYMFNIENQREENE